MPPAVETWADPPSLEYGALRQAALVSLARIAGTTWTDHNAHDPGVTILEQLCYTLTDLAYRAGFSVPDLLADPLKPGPDDSLFTPAQILTSNPVTLEDWRKLILDVEGVSNAWIEPVEVPEPALFYDPGDDTLYFTPESHRTPVPLRGIYRVLVEADPDAGFSKDDLRAAVDRQLQSHRNVGEDFDPTTILDRQFITVSAQIEVGEVQDPAALLATIYRALQDHLVPRIRFYNLAEMLARGRSLDQVFNGPRLAHGFIDTEELRTAERRSGLRASDVIAVLMAIDGVKAVHGLKLGEGNQRESWYLPLSPSMTPCLDVAGSDLGFRRGQVVWTPAPELRRQLAETLPATRARRTPTAESLDRIVPVGRPRGAERYYSFQNDLPAVYGVGRAGLSDGALPVRQAQARQLSAYLMFFDQVLAGSFGQLAHARKLLSFTANPDTSYIVPTPPEVSLGSDVFGAGFDEVSSQSLLGGVIDPDRSRLQQFLAHLLARFAEEFHDLSMIEAGGETENSPDRRAQFLEARRAFLREYPKVSGGRARAFDATLPSWEDAGAGNVSGLELRIARKLGLAKFSRRPLANLGEDDAGGFHLIEHILLRPSKADREQWLARGDTTWRPPAFLIHPRRADPYSSQLTLVFPAWLRSFGKRSADGAANEPARFVEKTVREETPAHLGVRVLWFDRAAMTEFERAYQTWLTAIAKSS